jgi:hypothetical protein
MITTQASNATASSARHVSNARATLTPRADALGVPLAGPSATGPMLRWGRHAPETGAQAPRNRSSDGRVLGPVDPNGLRAAGRSVADRSGRAVSAGARV